MNTCCRLAGLQFPSPGASPAKLPMRPPRYLQPVLVGATALLFAGAQLAPRSAPGPVLSAAESMLDGSAARSSSVSDEDAARSVLAAARSAVAAFAGAVRPMSRPEALEDAFRSYFAFKTAHPDKVRKPYLYFVDYGLPSTEPRGYLFDMSTFRVVDGPFTVAHGRGSSTSQFGVPTHFSNSAGSAATSLGLYVAQSTYGFVGHIAGGTYRSLGLRLMGVSSGFNDKALDRGVVAHGAPYVTSSRAGRSEGCPAMETARAQRLLPKLADGGMVFLFAPNDDWLSRDPWITGSGA